jgi:serine/threonine protein kinase
MTPERWREVERLYHAALERGPDARGAFLAEACPDDEGLRREVATLLAYDDSGASFLSSPALDIAARALAAQTQAEDPADQSSGADSGGAVAHERPATDSLAAGEVVRKFRILRKIGEGGMGQVYEAEDVRLGRRVALKLLRGGAGSSPEAAVLPLREARAASALNHPNIVTVYAVEESGGLDFIVMEYIEGETLKDRLERGPLAPSQLLDLGLQVCAAVGAAHARGIVHRDLKPGNILITPGGQAKVVDFGLAKQVSPPGTPDAGGAPATGPSSAGLIVGTPA